MVDHRGAARRTSQEERRRIILDAALATFAAKGFASARIEDIAKAAGVGKGTGHAASRDSLARHD